MRKQRDIRRWQLLNSNESLISRVRNEDSLDNEFYRVLLDGNQVDDAFALEIQRNDDSVHFPTQYLWRRGNRNDFMLNADMALARDLEGHIDPVTGFVTCNLNGDCPDSPLLPFAMEYASSNAAWLRDFRTAFIKMTSVGCDNGECTKVESFEELLESNTVVSTVATSSSMASFAAGGLVATVVWGMVAIGL